MSNPVGCHLNGGVNLPTTWSALYEVGTRLRGRLRRITDGEVDPEGQQATDAGEPRRGARQQWIWFLTKALEHATGLEEVEPLEMWGDQFPQFGLLGAAEDVAFPRGLGYADAYEASYHEFLELRDQGYIDPGVRFQVQFPTPLAAAFWIAAADRDAVTPAIARALYDEVDEFLSRVDPDDVAIQWDVAVEFGLLEGWFGEKVPVEVVADLLAPSVNAIRSEVPVGLHLCYGDYRHKHLSAPESLDAQVQLINAVNARVRREVGWYAITVPQDEVREEFFAPLAGLRVAFYTELYFGIVPYHPDDQSAGTTERQVELIERYIQSAHGAGRGPVSWGVCTECGMARVERQDVRRLLEIHREITAAYPHVDAP